MAADGNDDQQNPASGNLESEASIAIPPPGAPPPAGEQPELSDDDLATAGPVMTSQQLEPRHKFRWWALGIIAGLCLLTGTGTLLTAALSTHDGATQVASDIAKTAIPTLLTLLGTATAWAFKSED